MFSALNKKTQRGKKFYHFSHSKIINLPHLERLKKALLSSTKTINLKIFRILNNIIKHFKLLQRMQLFSRQYSAFQFPRTIKLNSREARQDFYPRNFTSRLLVGRTNFRLSE